MTVSGVFLGETNAIGGGGGASFWVTSRDSELMNLWLVPGNTKAPALRCCGTHTHTQRKKERETCLFFSFDENTQLYM